MIEQYDALQFPFKIRKMQLSHYLIVHDVPDWENQGFIVVWDEEHGDQILDDILDELDYWGYSI